MLEFFFLIKKAFSYSRKTFEINILDKEVFLELKPLPQMVQPIVNPVHLYPDV